MESYRNMQNKEEKLLTNIWDAFVNHIDSIYFPGASELLERQTLAYEFDFFTTHYRKE